MDKISNEYYTTLELLCINWSTEAFLLGTYRDFETCIICMFAGLLNWLLVVFQLLCATPQNSWPTAPGEGRRSDSPQFRSGEIPSTRIRIKCQQTGVGWIWRLGLKRFGLKLNLEPATTAPHFFAFCQSTAEVRQKALVIIFCRSDVRWIGWQNRCWSSLFGQGNKIQTLKTVSTFLRGEA